MPSRIDELVETAQRKARKVEQFIALLRDPDIADLVTELTREASTEASRNTTATNGHAVSTFSPSLTPQIRQLAPALPNRFTVNMLVDLLKRENFKFTRDPLEAVRDAVYFLARGENRIFEIVEQGRGGNPSFYEYIGH